MLCVSSSSILKNLRNLRFRTQNCMFNTPDFYRDALADFNAAQFNHPFTFFTNTYKPMIFITLQILTCTIYATNMHNLITFPAQFVQIFTLFFTIIQTKMLYFNNISNEKLFLPAQIMQLSTPFSLIINPIAPATCTHSPVQIVQLNPITITYSII
jgi:hypothetical protein